MKDFRKLLIWNKSHALALDIYKVTSKFPQEEKFGIIAQLRRCATSVPANIAEGCCRNGDKNFAHFLHIAMGSASEVKYFLILSKDLSYIDKEIFEKLQSKTDEVLKILSVFISKLRKYN